MFLCGPLYAEELNITYVNEDAQTSDSLQIRADIRLFDDQFNELDSTFGFENNVQETKSSVKSGDEIILKKDEKVKIKDLPAQTNYRISVKEKILPTIDFKQPSVSGNVSTLSNVEITGMQTERYPIYYFSFITNYQGNSKLNNPVFKYQLTQTSGENAIIPDNPIQIKGTGLYTIPIKFTKNGNYEFTLKQVEADGLLVDGQTHTLEISYTVNPVLETVRISAKIDGVENNDPPEFYPTEPQISYEPKIKKTVQGKTSSKDLFSFNLAADESQPSEGFKLPNNTLVQCNGENEMEFSPIVFYKPGDYHFKINEVTGKEPGFAYDTNTWKLNLQINQEQNGSLKVNQVEYIQGSETSDKATFTNIFRAGNLKITKHVVNRDNEQRKFKFKITLTDGENTEIEDSFSTNIESINLKSGDTFELGNNESITINNIPVGVKYLVEELDIPVGYASQIDKANGTIESSDTVEVICTNSFTKGKTSLVLPVTKNLSGQTPRNEQSYTFVLTPGTDNPENGDDIVETKKLTITGKGDYQFDPITYTKEGIYHYTLSEEKQEIPGYIFDETTYEIEVTVNLEDTGLELGTVTYTKTGSTQNSEKPVFTNIYQPEIVTTQAKIKKEIQGTPGKNEIFNFRIQAKEEYPDVEMPANLTSQITGTGENTFEAIKFKKAGIYVFSITEDNGGALGFEYDTSIWNYTVTVTDDNGRLKAIEAYAINQHNSQEEVDNNLNKESLNIANVLNKITSLFITRVDAAENKATFKNDFITGSLEIQKNVPGEENLTDQEFSFSLKLMDSTGKELSGTFTTNEGKVISSGSKFTLKNGEALTIVGIPADSTYEVTEDKIKGFKAQSETLTGKIRKDLISHCNFINIPDDSVNLTVTKIVDGISDESFNFKLVLTDSNGKELEDSYPLGEDKEIRSGETLSLKKDESITVSGLPKETKYEITEEENENFNVDNPDGTGVLSENKEITITNKPKDQLAQMVNAVIPKTGDSLSLLIITVLIIALLGYLVLKFKVKKRS